MTVSSDLLVSYPRRRFFQARREIVRVLERVGDPAPLVERSSVPGIAIVHTRVDSREAIKRCRELSAGELPLEFAVKWVPVDLWCETSLEAIRQALEAHVRDRIADAQTWAMKVEKRRWEQHHTTDIIAALAPSIPRTVDLQHPDRIVRIDVLGTRTAISLLAPGEVFSIGTSTGPSRRRETGAPVGRAVADQPDEVPGDPARAVEVTPASSGPKSSSAPSRNASATGSTRWVVKPDFEPGYVRLSGSELTARVTSAYRHLEDCDLCARYCHVSRRQTTKGAVCRTGERAVVHSFGPHHGEEGPLRGSRGSGTIFFSWCNLRCVFCQNWEISRKGIGREIEPDELAAMMLALQREGCHNINLVTPSHVVAQILAAMAIAAREGLRLPLVYNTGGHDSPEALALLDGVVDIYMPDMKYGDSETAQRYSHVRNYWEVNRAAVKEMHRQVGDLVIDEAGLARRGLLVRHLVLPGDLANTDSVLAFLAAEISRETYLNLMSQYRPCYRAWDYPPLDRPITREEFDRALAAAATHGLHRLDRPTY